MIDYDGGNERGLPAWDEASLSLGRPGVMDTPTLIEWIERQLETPEEFEKRTLLRNLRHKEWHNVTPGIFACCITAGFFGVRNSIYSTNEARRMCDRS